MTLTNLSKAPFPYYGGKSQAAPAVWAALGDCPHFVDPFCGSLAVLLLRPHPCNRPYYSETANDKDGLLVNALRSLQLSPDATAEAASWWVAEADLMARHLAILRWQDERDLERLMADPFYHDPVIAGYWIYGMSCWIGSGFASGAGPWVVGADGRITKRPNNGGVARKRPHLGNDGRGVHHAGAREAGVARKRPHLANNGQGVNRPQGRETGVARQLPHLGNDGQGVNRPQGRETGVARQLPHLANNGQGVHHAGARETGVARKLPHTDPTGRGVVGAQMFEPGVATGRGEYDETDAALIIPDDLHFHPATMPEVRRWFAFLSARLRHVRICNGDWRRVVTTGAAFTLPVRQGDGPCGVFLDPPYVAGRADGLYNHDSLTVAHDAAEWAVEHGGDSRFRIVYAGYAGDHDALFEAHDWRQVEWFQDGWLRGGMGNQSANGHQQGRERLWCSPHCPHCRQLDLPMFAGIEREADYADD